MKTDRELLELAAKAAPVKGPSRPKVDFVVSCAVVLVNSLVPSDAERVLSGEAAGMCIFGPILADLITAVREMRSGEKPIEALDAFKQLPLMEQE